MKVTVLIPFYNTRPDYLFESVYSILNQTDKTAHDILLIDDGSDDTLTILASITLDEMSDRIKLISLMGKVSGTGGGRALNFGLHHATTEFIAIQDSDDISHPDRFRKQIDFLEKHPSCDAIGTGIFGFKNGDIHRKPLFTTIHPHLANTGKGWFINHGTSIYRRERVIQAGGYSETLLKGYDVDMWARLKKSGAVIRNVESVLYAWRRYV